MFALVTPLLCAQTGLPAACSNACHGTTCAAFQSTPCTVISAAPFNCDCTGCTMCNEETSDPPTADSDHVQLLIGASTGPHTADFFGVIETDDRGRAQRVAARIRGTLPPYRCSVPNLNHAPAAPSRTI